MPQFNTSYSTTNRLISTSTEPSLVDETFSDECDISLMIDKYRMSKIPPRTVDISYGYSPTPEDFQNAQYLLAEVKTNFEKLPSSERDKFGNDVQAYLSYISDNKNLKDCYERGLINPDSVDLRQIYPERFETLVQEPSKEVSIDIPPVTPQPIEKDT